MSIDNSMSGEPRRPLFQTKPIPSPVRQEVDPLNPIQIQNDETIALTGDEDDILKALQNTNMLSVATRDLRLNPFVFKNRITSLEKKLKIKTPVGKRSDISLLLISAMAKGLVPNEMKLPDDFKMPKLSRQEINLLILLANNPERSEKELAEQLNIGEEQVRIYVVNFCKIFSCANRYQVMLYAKAMQNARLISNTTINSEENIEEKEEVFTEKVFLGKLIELSREIDTLPKYSIEDLVALFNVKPNQNLKNIILARTTTSLQKTKLIEKEARNLNGKIAQMINKAKSDGFLKYKTIIINTQDEYGKKREEYYIKFTHIDVEKIREALKAL